MGDTVALLSPLLSAFKLSQSPVASPSKLSSICWWVLVGANSVLAPVGFCSAKLLAQLGWCLFPCSSAWNFSQPVKHRIASILLKQLLGLIFHWLGHDPITCNYVGTAEYSTLDSLHCPPEASVHIPAGCWDWGRNRWNKVQAFKILGLLLTCRKGLKDVILFQGRKCFSGEGFFLCLGSWSLLL